MSFIYSAELKRTQNVDYLHRGSSAKDFIFDVVVYLAHILNNNALNSYETKSKKICLYFILEELWKHFLMAQNECILSESSHCRLCVWSTAMYLIIMCVR